MDVLLLRLARDELSVLPTADRRALDHALEKLRVAGDRLPFPHSSQVRGTAHLRELRPRAGRSPWRAFYRRVGNRVVIAAIGPEAQHDPLGFRRAVAAAEERLAQFSTEEHS